MAKRSSLFLVVLSIGAITLAQERPSNDAVAIVGARVYTSPDAPVLSDATVVVAGGEIRAVGQRESVRIPAGTRVIDGSGLTVTAGFWNNHVHFTDRQWDNAASLRTDQLSRQIAQMLTRYGYTTVFDTGSLLSNTLALRRRVESGEVPGPRILTAGEPFTARDGTPYYVKPIRLPELLTEPQARDAVRNHIAAGADAIKLHAGAILDKERDVRIAVPLDLVRAVTVEAHRLGKPVLAHPQYLDGLSVSVHGGVDVLVHVTELVERWPHDLLARAVKQNMALVPTLKLLAGMQVTTKQTNLLRQVSEYRAAGGEILFGTDVGFIPDYDPQEEYLLMQQAGMSGRDILRALTVAPSTRFRPAARTGQIAVGYEGDLVVLGGDPAQDARNFARVRATVRGGAVIFALPSGK
jgi:imidazolonepropionase-like amidohydrolase